MLVKPAPGRAIRDPDTMQLVPEEGQNIDEAAPFWARALLDEDLVPAAPPTTPAPPARSGSAALKPEGSAS